LGASSLTHSVVVLHISSSIRSSQLHLFEQIYFDMAPVEPSFIMFSVKLQGSEAVSVRVVACSNLPDMDGPGNKSDPYVKVILNENKQKTKVAESYRNPVFEEFSSTFIFPLNPMGNEVFFEVWDKDRLSKDDLMGKASILLNPQLLSVAESGAFLCLPLAKK